MAGLCGFIEPKRQVRLIGNPAIPFAILVAQATKLPCRQLDLDQGKRRIGPSIGLDQPANCLGLADPVQRSADARTLAQAPEG